MAREKVVLDKEELNQLYTVEGKSIPQIAALKNCATRTVAKKLRKHGIHVRTLTEAQELMWRSEDGKRKKMSDERRLKISCSCKKGADHHFWRGGNRRSASKLIRESVRYRIWRDAVFTRDNYTCQHCGQRGGYLEADHIKQFALYPDLRFEVSNGRTLCKKCHREVTREQTRQREKPLESV